MRKAAFRIFALGALWVPVFVWAIPQQIGGINNNIMEEDKWDNPPDYEAWRLDGEGRDGKAPVAGDPAPKVFANLTPVEIFGLAAPAGSARLTSDGRRWLSVEIHFPGRESDVFHLLESTLKAESEKDISVAGKKPERYFSASVKGFHLEVRESESGGMHVSVSRTPAGSASAAG